MKQTKINLLQDNCCCYCEEEEEDSWVKVVEQCLQKSWTTTKENVRYVVPPRKSSLKLVNSALRRSHLYYQNEPAYKGVEERKQVRVRLGIFRGLMRQRSRSDFDRLRRKRRNSPQTKIRLHEIHRDLSVVGRNVRSLWDTITYRKIDG